MKFRNPAADSASDTTALRCAPRARAALLGIALALLPASSRAAAEPIVVDSGDDASAWTAIASPNATARIEPGNGSFALDFDLGRGRGHAIARRAVSVDLPPDYMFVFDLQSDAEPNTIEIKFISGENVWWRRLPDFDLGGQLRDSRPLRVSKPRISFAWGPAGGGMPSHLDAIEIAVVAGKGGKGKLRIDDIRIEPRDPGAASRPPSVMTSGNNEDAAKLLDGDVSTVWRSVPFEKSAEVMLDFYEPIEQGGLEIDHAPDAFSRAYVVEASIDGQRWDEARRFTNSNGGVDYVYLPDVYARWLRIRFENIATGKTAAIGEIRVQPFDFSSSINGFFTGIARAAEAGLYPRYFRGEQSYWTVVGTPGDANEALINEEGMIEVGAGGFSLDPFLLRGSDLRTWKAATSIVSLDSGELPIPTVERSDGDLTLSITAFASGTPGASTLYVRYRVATRGAAERVGLVAAIRPFQVLPPWQALNRTGGATTVRRIERHASTIEVDGRQVIALSELHGFGATSFEEGDISEFLARDAMPDAASTEDPFGHASAALAWNVDVAPGKPADVWLALPWTKDARVEAATPASLNALLARTREAWRQHVARVPIELPPAVADWAASLRSNLAYILINADGDAIQPGSRTYERSWIRDGAMTSGALLELGLNDEVKAFLRWYAGYIGKDGYVPCCVDARGADPVPENDSYGEFIWAIAEVWRFTRDDAFVKEMWPHVRAVVSCMNRLRESRMTPEYREGDKRAMFGLLPESISHEGYSARPVHSYWDQAFALRGFADAAALAYIAGDKESISSIGSERDDFRRDLAESIRLTIESHKLDIVPASVELGDFDPTSTAVSFLLGTEGVYPPDALARSFDKYASDLAGRRGLETPGVGYTAYELRNATALVLIGRKQAAIDMLTALVDDQRPPAWNQWPEISWLKKTEPSFLGDLPHTWIGSTFVHAVRTLLVAEREGGSLGDLSTASLLVGAGIPLRWIEGGAAVRARSMPTWFGPVSVEIRGETTDPAVRRAIVHVEAASSAPSSRQFGMPGGGVEIAAPFGAEVEGATIDGASVVLESGAVRVKRLPATVVFQYKPPRE